MASGSIDLATVETVAPFEVGDRGCFSFVMRSPERSLFLRFGGGCCSLTPCFLLLPLPLPPRAWIFACSEALQILTALPVRLLDPPDRGVRIADGRKRCLPVRCCPLTIKTLPYLN